MSTIAICGTQPPGVRPPTDHVYYSTTKSLCKACKRGVDAKIVFRSEAVYFEKFCADHGPESVLVASSVEWYLDALSFVAHRRLR